VIGQNSSDNSRNLETVALFQLLTPSACNITFFGPTFGPKKYSCILWWAKLTPYTENYPPKLDIFWTKFYPTFWNNFYPLIFTVWRWHWLLAKNVKSRRSACLIANCSIIIMLLNNLALKKWPLYKVQYNYIIECCLKDKNGRLSI
jgi:hypothetical protein